MTAGQFSQDEAQPMTLEVECGGRTFSPSPLAPSASPRPPIRRLHERREETELPGLLHKAIFSRLAWHAVPPDDTDRQTLVKAYIDSLKQLDGFRRDANDTVQCACLANLEFRQQQGETNIGARDSVSAATLDEMLSQASAHWLPLTNVLDGKLLAQPISLLRGQLQTALSDAAADFSKHFLELLARLVDRQLFGLVEWLPNHCCNYHFFNQAVIQENEGASQRTTETRIDELLGRDPDATRRGIGRRTIQDIQRHGKHYHRFARHEHSVMNAVRTTIRNSRVVIPLQVEPLLKSIPEWLYPLVQMIDGDIIRERIIEQDTNVENWADVRVRDEPIFGREPAVIVGPYVLTGWGPREIGQEQARRQTIQHTPSQKHAAVTAGPLAPWLTAVLVAVTLVASTSFFQWLQEYDRRAFGLTVAFAVLGLVWQMSCDVPTAPGSPASSPAMHLRAANIACRIFILYLVMSYWFLAMFWPAPVVIAFIAVLCYVIGGRFQEARLHECLSGQGIL